MSHRIAIICARGGSKGVPGKNTRPLHGKPLILYSVEQAFASGLFDAVAVSSDDADILGIADSGRQDGLHLIQRPGELATDTAPKLPAIRHGVERVEETTGQTFDVIADLAVTSPLRDAEDIRGAVALLESSDADAVLSGHRTVTSPYFNIVEEDADGHITLSKDAGDASLNRQTSPVCHALNGAVYVWRRDALFDGSNSSLKEKTKVYLMPEDRSFDIDTPLDWKIVEFLLKDRDG
jgi:CMP-N-acetylneuraminic acid synthetase